MLIKAKIFPNSKKEGIIKKSEDSFEIRVKTKPTLIFQNQELELLKGLNREIRFLRLINELGH